MRARIAIERSLYVVGLALLGLSAWAACDGWLAQANLTRRLDSLLGRREPSGLVRGEALAARREARGSGLVGRIEIPRLGLSAMIVEGTSTGALRRGVGHVEDTAFPGERGNVALAGHRDSYFRRLGRVRTGDLVRLRTPDGAFAYRVVSTQVVTPDRGDLLAGTPGPMLTLVTCYPFDWIGPAPERFVVRAVSLASASTRGRGAGRGVAARAPSPGARSNSDARRRTARASLL
jgi:sortase A